MRTPAGRHGIESFFTQYCADELRGPPKVLHAPGHSFSDVARKVVSIINLASVSALETAIGAPVNPLRFRGNVYVEGWPAWHEFDLLGREIAIEPVADLMPECLFICREAQVHAFNYERDLETPKTGILEVWHRMSCVADAGR